MRQQPFLIALLCGVSGLAVTGAGEAQTLPSGGAVQQGMATIGLSAPGAMVVDQTSQRAVIDWASFSIGKGGHVQFNNGAGATLNRVLGGDPSSIAGQLRATGSLWLVNPAGVLVDSTGRVNSGGSVFLSTRAVDAGAFMAGATLLANGGNTAGIVQAGAIEAGGDAVLIGHFVENRGSIRAGGTAALVAADRVVLRALGGDGRIHVESATGGNGDVTTSGRIEAATAELRAAGGNVYALAADTGGVVRATGVAQSGGRIFLVGGGDVTVSGTLDASGAAGGNIDATAGSRVMLEGSAQLLATGQAGDGGSIRIGGARQGGLPDEARPLASAQGVFVNAGAVIDANSAAGRGGEVILWSEKRTRFDGIIRADGPLAGGFVETSSKDALQIGAGQAFAGNGQWLLDPRNVIIRAGGPNVVPPGADVTINPPPGSGAYEIAGQFVTNALNSGTNVTITTTQPGSTDAGNITVNWTFNLNGAGSLRLQADNDIIVNNASTLASTGNLRLSAGRDVLLASTQTISGAGSFLVQAGRNITANSTATGTAAGSGSFTYDAGNLLTINSNIQHNGSGNVTLIGRGDGIRFGGSGNRNFFTTSGVFRLQAPGPAGDIIFGRTPDSFGNMRWSGGTGGLTAEAGRDIRLVPGSGGNGRWVRVGTLTDTGPLTMSAGRNVDLSGGPVLDDFAEILGSGAMAINAGARILLSNSVSPARIQSRGPSLTLNTPSGQYGGLVESRGDTLLTGGVHAFSVAPLFQLDASRSFILADGARIEATVALTIGTSGRGDISFGGQVDGVSLTAVAGDQFAVRAPISMTAGGDSLVLAAGTRFTFFGAAGLAAPAGRWLTYSVSPFDDVGEELLNSTSPNLYGRSFAGNPPASITPANSSRRLYSFRPTLTLTADSGSKTYGSVPVPALSFTTSGLVPGDDLAVALAGPPVVTSAGIPATAPVGSYTTTVAATASDQGYLLTLDNGTLVVNPAALTVNAIATSKIYGAADPALTFAASGFVLTDTAATVLTGSLARTPGETVAGSPYAITQGTLVANSNYTLGFTGANFTIDRRPLGITLVGQVARIYDATLLAPLRDANIALANLVPGDVVTASAAQAVYNTPDVGNGKLVTASGISLSGASASNYNAATMASAAIGLITPAPLSVRALDAARPFGQPNPPLLLTAQGLKGSDTLAGIGLTAVTSATTASPPDLYPIDVAGTPRNYTLTRQSGVLAVTPSATAVLPPQQVSVPALGGLVQQGVTVGSSAITDTLGYAASGAKRMIATNRFTISIEPALPVVVPGILGGSDAFDPHAVTGQGRVGQ